jgi:hypothetical protein
MTNARTVRPTDLVALVSYDGKVYPNAALTRDRIGTEASPHPLETALEQWFSFATGRHTWISIKGATLRGLASARRRGSKAAWEVDCLIDAADDDESVLMSLLDQVVADAGRGGAEKIFLRVEADSPIVEAATRCGFAPFMNERLLATETAQPATKQTSGHQLRRWSRSDAYPTFRLYNRWAPETVRRVEAATFREWQSARERVSPRRGTQQRILEIDGRIAGWLRTAADGEVGRFDLMADPADSEILDALIDGAVGRLSEQSALFTLVPLFATSLGQHLEDRGFAEQGDFTVLARRTTKTVDLPKLAPKAVQSFPT